jgi:DNA-binding response OmpR family regulator
MTSQMLSLDARGPAHNVRIATVSDDPAELELMGRILLGAGHACRTFSQGHEVMEALREERFDLLIVDSQLPDASGRDIVLWVRTQLQRRMPVLFLTHSWEERDLVEALDKGADALMIKPARAGELLARVAALARRGIPLPQGSAQSVGRYRINRQRRVIELDGQPTELPPRQYDLAQYFFAHLGQVLTRKQLLYAVWRDASALGSSRKVDVHVSSVRRRLALQPGNGVQLDTMPGVGYRLSEVAYS